MATTAEVHQGSLAKLPILAGCSEREIEVLHAHSTELRVRAGRTLCRAGAPARQVVVLLEGFAEADRTHTGPQLGPGAVVGATEILGERVHTSTIVTRTVSLVLVLNAVEFAALRVLAPAVADRLAGVIPAARPQSVPSIPLARPGLGALRVSPA